MNSQPLHVLQLIDGKRGHEVQVEGLLAALGASRALQLTRCRYDDGSALRALPQRPALVIAAGSATHSALLRWGLFFRAKTVLLMRPKWPSFLYDACIIPAHDNPAARGNIFVSEGSLNAIRGKTAAQADAGLILLGGPSKHVRWDSGRMLEQIRALVQANPGIRWQLSSSRRTPEGFLQQLAALPNLQAHAVDALPPGWLLQQYAKASVAFVSNDSVNMIYEALTAGLRVGLLSSPPVAGSRVMRGIARLVAARTIGPAVCAVPELPPATGDFNEAERCARWLLERGIVA